MFNFHCHVLPKIHAFLCPGGKATPSGTIWDHSILIRLVVKGGVIGLRVIGLGA